MIGWDWFGTPEGASALWWESFRAALAGKPVTQSVDIIRSAVEIERAAVVEWLMSRAVVAADTIDEFEPESLGQHLAAAHSLAASLAAHAIERGDHRGGVAA